MSRRPFFSRGRFVTETRRPVYRFSNATALLVDTVLFTLVAVIADQIIRHGLNNHAWTFAEKSLLGWLAAGLAFAGLRHLVERRRWV